MNFLSNSDLSISIKETGAELCSILDKKLNLEYLWQGDSSVWGRQSPVLFPIVGRLKENSFLFKGKKYSLPQHGFARDYAFKIIAKQTDKIVFSLDYTVETLEIFPFKFELQIGYQLSGRKLTVTYKVVNQDDQGLLFSIGAHPGFRCPLNEDESYEDYFLEFSRPENLSLR
ncbi:MAG TPA: hypothetical protein VK766_07250, partial [Cytophagaceae bacterium]|nr:hypothetical protein [Cytophagaceae bacterium]